MQYLSPFPGFKKTHIVAKRETELRHALKRGAGEAKVLKAAEKLRSTKLHLLKALKSGLMTFRGEDPAPKEQLRHIDAEMELWETRSTEAIVEEYRRG